MKLPYRTQKERLAYYSLGALLLFGAGYASVKFLRPRPQVVIQAMSPPRDRGSLPSATPADEEPVVVHVAGAVKNPGVYKLPEGSRVIDAVKAAGGFKGKVNQEVLNLAAKIIDGTQLCVDCKTDTAGSYGGTTGTSSVYAAAPPAAATGSGKHPTGIISLNSATAEQLESLPGIGASRANAILSYRQDHHGFKSVDELTAVGGIGEKRLASIKRWLKP